MKRKLYKLWVFYFNQSFSLGKNINKIQEIFWFSYCELASNIDEVKEWRRREEVFLIIKMITIIINFFIWRKKNFFLLIFFNFFEIPGKLLRLNLYTLYFLWDKYIFHMDKMSCILWFKPLRIKIEYNTCISFFFFLLPVYHLVLFKKKINK